MGDTGRFKRPTHVTLENVEKEVSALRGDVAEIRDDVVELQRTVTAHEAADEVKFSNGRKVMGDMKTDIDSLKPKAPDWQKLLLAGFTVIAVLMGAQLWITEALNERMTYGAMEKRVAPLEMAQKELTREMQRLSESQAAQAESLETIKESINVLLQRTEPPPQRKRRRP